MLFLTAIFLMPLLPDNLGPAAADDRKGSGNQPHHRRLPVSVCLARLFSRIAGVRLYLCWLTHRWSVFLSAVIIGVALIGIALWQRFWALQAGLTILGVGAGLYLPSGIATITALVQRRHWGKALAVHELAPISSLYLLTPDL